MSLRTSLTLAALSLAACASSAQAVFVLGNGQSIGLSDVLNSNDRQFQVGDKLFTILTWSSPDFTPNTVSLTGFIASNPLTGIGFDITGGFGDATPGNTAFADFVIRYTVEIAQPFLDQGFRIVDSELTFNGNATGTGSFARVDESVLDFNLPAGQNLIGQKQVFSIAGPPASQDLQDRLVFTPRTKLEIIKDVQFFATAGGTSSASFVRQSFSQIPTPGAMGIMAVGLLAIARRRR